MANQSRKTAAALFAALLFALASPAGAEECPDCIQRKKRMCAEECKLVPAERSIECQKGCILEYCAHRCPEGHPALAEIGKEECQDCLEEQFNLCEPNCATGTDRQRAICRLDCSEKRCADKCRPPAEPEKREGRRWLMQKDSMG